MNTSKTTDRSSQAAIAVMGATGRIGKRITEQLLKTGANVRALGRSENKLSELKNSGAEPFAGEAADTAFLTNAFRGVDAVYTLLPYGPDESDYYAQQNKVSAAIIEATRQSGVQTVVFLSSLGADQASDTGAILSLHNHEERLRGIGNINVAILRPGPFFENLYGVLEVIKQEGIGGDAFAPDLPLPMIATRDIADAAAAALRARDWKGIVVRELLGARDITFAEVTRIIGERIGMPDLQYVQFPYEDTIKALQQFGFSESIATVEVEVARAANEGRIGSCEGRTAKNTTPTRFEDFVEELVQAYQATREPLQS
jgi:uncharacterized protein YbjT (DUF2867 family)